MIELMFLVAILGVIAWVSLPLFLGEETSVRDLWYWYGRVRVLRRMVKAVRHSLRVLDDKGAHLADIGKRLAAAHVSFTDAEDLRAHGDYVRRRYPAELAS